MAAEAKLSGEALMTFSYPSQDGHIRHGVKNLVGTPSSARNAHESLFCTASRTALPIQLIGREAQRSECKFRLVEIIHAIVTAYWP